jgi:hypothetical protein
MLEKLLRHTCLISGSESALQVTEQILKAFGVMTCGQLVEQRAVLSALFSKVSLCRV